MRPRTRSTLLGTLLAVAACGGTDRGAAAANESVKVEVSVSAHLTGAVFYIGVEEGYFADEGIEMVIQPATESGATSIPSLDRGQVAVNSMNNLIAIANGIDQGARIRIVAGTSYAAPGRCSPSALVARRGLFPEDRPITPADLRGKRIDINPLSSEGYFLDVFLARGGLSLDDIEAVSLPITARLEALERGAIDLTGTPEPWLSRMVDAGHRVVLTRTEVIPDFQSSYLVYGSRLLDEDRETGRRFMSAFLRSVRQFNEGPTDRNVEIAEKFTGLSPEELRRVCWPVMRPAGELRLPQILAFQRWALDHGLMQRIVGLDELRDPWFTEEALGLAAGEDAR